MIVESIKFAYDCVNNFTYKNILKNTCNKFDFEYSVPEIKGICKFEWGKKLDSVKPSTLEYIIYHLHNAEVKLVIDSVIAYLYYWKIRKADTKTMKLKYKEILQHYEPIKDELIIPTAMITNVAIVYSISFTVGIIQTNKFGIATDKNRYKKMIDDVKSKYPLVSVSNFKVNQEIQFNTVKQAEEFEKEALKNLKQHRQYKKGKICFDGYTESYSVIKKI